MYSDVTFKGLNCWYKHVFERLGWMLLAKAHGYNIQITAYKNSIDELEIHLANKLKTIKDKDRKTDIKILLDNTKILKSFADKL